MTRVVRIALVTTADQSRRSDSFYPQSRSNAARMAMNSPSWWLPTYLDELGHHLGMEESHLEDWGL